MVPLPRTVREMQNILGSKVSEAYKLAARIHKDEKRKSGEAYITHPLAVAKLLFDAGADVDVVCAALLHDSLEAQENAKDIANEIYTNFGDQVLYLVEAVSKDDTIEDKVEQQAAYMAQIERSFDIDIFAFFIKMADLLHNMGTISALPAARKEQWVRELRYLYFPVFSAYFHRVPLVHRDLFISMLAKMEEIVDSYDRGSQKV